MREDMFDVEALVGALNRKRRAEGLSWRQVAVQAGVMPLTFSRMTLDSGAPSVENLCRMLVWLGDTDLKPYLREGSPQQFL